VSSELFDPIFGMSAVAAALDDRAWVAALCETETALARACARAGIVELADALEVGAECERLAAGEVGDLGRLSVAGGNPVIPLVAALRERVRERAGDSAAAAVHRGATSQDIMDTALMLLTQRALGILLTDLGACADAAAGHAREHRQLLMAGRTLSQQALPTTFGAVAAVWGAGLDHNVATLTRLRAELPVQLGGAAGTLSVLHPHGFEVRAALADELGLADPHRVWHTDRTVITDLAGALGGTAATIAKVATDVVLLAQSELGELHEGAPGGSSAMAHKQNPIAAITARAAAAQAPGLVATLLGAAPELQRGAGPWHAEWPAYGALLCAVGGAAARLRASLSGLHVDAAAMGRHLDELAEFTNTTDAGHAPDLVEHYLEGRTR
jgi:3-carboxy-cis,cis-muconate cycloisomerase